MRAKRLGWVLGLGSSLFFARHASADTWTVLGYIAADNDLEEYAIPNIEEMTRVGSTDKLKILLQVSRQMKYSDAPIQGLQDFRGTKRVEIQKGTAKEIEDLGEVDGAQPATLAEFIKWGIKRHPADHYAVIFWDHGAGWQGCCEFERNPEGKTGMSLASIALGIRNGLAGSSRPKLDLVGFDQCLMANLEVAYELAPIVKVMVASEELEPGDGWDYEGLLQAIVENPAIDAAALGKAIADGYAANIEKKGPDPTITLSVLDLTKLPALVTALDIAGAALTPLARSAETWSKIGKARGDADGFGREGEEDSTGLVDLAMLLKGVPHPAARQAIDALEQVVLYQVRGAAHDSVGGLSIYLPERTSDPEYRGIAFPRAAKWGPFVGAYVSGASEDRTPITIADLKIDATEALVTVSASVGDSDVDDLDLLVARVEPNGQHTVLGALPAQKPGADGKVSARFDRKSFIVTDGKTEDLAPFFTVKKYTHRGKAKAILSAPADVKLDKGEYQAASVVFEVDLATHDATLLGAYEVGRTGGGALNLKGNGKVRPMIAVAGDTGRYKLSPGKVELSAKSLAVKWQALAPGKYEAGFRAKDYAGNEDSKTAAFDIAAPAVLPASTTSTAAGSGPAAPGKSASSKCACHVVGTRVSGVGFAGAALLVSLYLLRRPARRRNG